MYVQGMYLCTCIVSRGRFGGILLYCSLHHSTETGFLTESRARLISSQPQPSSFLPSPQYWDIEVCGYTQLLHECWGFELKYSRLCNKSLYPVNHSTASKRETLNNVGTGNNWLNRWSPFAPGIWVWLKLVIVSHWDISLLVFSHSTVSFGLQQGL